MTGTVQPKRKANTLRFSPTPNPKAIVRENHVASASDGTQRIVLDQNDPFQSVVIGSFNMQDGFVQAPNGRGVSHGNSPASIFAREPVSAARNPATFTARVSLELDRVGQLAETLKELTSAEPSLLSVRAEAPEPEAASPLPVEILERTRKSARDAWCAAVMMGTFIVAGIVWTSARLDASERRIVQLLDQLQVEQASSNALRLENRQAFDELADVKSRLNALQYRQEQAAR